MTVFSGRGITLPGVLDDGLLADWCLRYLGVPLDRVLFRSGSQQLDRLAGEIDERLDRAALK